MASLAGLLEIPEKSGKIRKNSQGVSRDFGAQISAERLFRHKVRWGDYRGNILPKMEVVRNVLKHPHLFSELP